MTQFSLIIIVLYLYYVHCLRFLKNIMHNRVISFLVNNNILFKYQFGFRKSHSTYQVLTILKEKLITSIENGDHVVGVYLDFSKAFDIVNHTNSMTKLYHYGIHGQALNWFKSYLENRKQFALTIMLDLH